MDVRAPLFSRTHAFGIDVLPVACLQNDGQLSALNAQLASSKRELAAQSDELQKVKQQVLVRVIATACKLASPIHL